MPNPIQSSLSPLEISENGGVTWLVCICTKSFNLPMQTQTTTEYTQCGPIIGIGPYSHDPVIQAICDIYPNPLQFSYKEAIRIQDAQVANTMGRIMYRIQYPGTGSVGFAYYICGAAYITDTQLTNQTNSAVAFSFTLKGNGEPSLVPGVLPAP
jgi:hypothetical protein